MVSNMAKFEFVEKYRDAGLVLPVRKTEASAGYDLVAAEDTVVPSTWELIEILRKEGELQADQGNFYTRIDEFLTLEEMEYLTKIAHARPTLIPTGVKCQLGKDEYLELSVRSSSPLKYWLVMANGVGIIDADYYNNPSNEGLIYLQLINLSPFPLMIQKGEAIGQGIIKNYLTVADDAASGTRTGGFGSTNA